MKEVMDYLKEDTLSAFVWSLDCCPNPHTHREDAPDPKESLGSSQKQTPTQGFE